MAIVKDAYGNELLEVITVSDGEVDPLRLDAPLTHALVVAKHQGKCLLLFNKYHRYWELPGGVIEQGETPRQCAIREPMEETNQVAGDLIFKGLLKFHLQPSFHGPERMEYGALFATELQQVRHFVENEEATRIIWWDGVTDIGYINEIDRALARWA